MIIFFYNCYEIDQKTKDSLFRMISFYVILSLIIGIEESLTTHLLPRYLAYGSGIPLQAGLIAQTAHITGSKKQSDEGASLFAVRVNVVGSTLYFNIIFPTPFFKCRLLPFIFKFIPIFEGTLASQKIFIP